MHTVFLYLIVAASILPMLVRPRGIAEVWWAGGGALLLIALRLVGLRDAGHAVLQGADVYFFLAGMMLLSELAREHGVFDWLASVSVSHAKGSAVRLFTLTYLIGTVVTICMSNDATAVVLTPAVLVAVKRARVPALPCLFGCAMIANAASFVMPISNPANLVVFRGGIPPLGTWLAMFLLPSIFSIAVTYVCLRLYFRRDLAHPVEAAGEPVRLNAEHRVVLGGIAAMVAVLLACSALKLDLGLPTFLCAVAIITVTAMRSRVRIGELVRCVSWSTLLLVAALFVLVTAVENAGALHAVESAIAWFQRRPPVEATLGLGFAVGVANNLVNNLPLGLIAGSAVHAASVPDSLRRAVLIGVDLGPNLSVTGSLATILWLLALRRGGEKVTAWQFLKAGLVVMPPALLAALGGTLLFR